MEEQCASFLHCICMSHIQDSRKTGCLHNSSALVRLVGHLSLTIMNHIGALFSICIIFKNNVWLQHLQLRSRSIISDSFTDSPIHLRLHCSSGLQLHLKRKPCTSLPHWKLSLETTPSTDIWFLFSFSFSTDVILPLPLVQSTCKPW